jgi:putative ABC transport system substrate-binding protein
MGAPADPLILSQRSRIVRFAVKHRIPAMYGFREFVSDGGLLSYGPNLMEMFRRSATYADRIPERRHGSCQVDARADQQ